ncbi:MAG: hypothetical protein H6733_16530 [Alphaproteobacteria bacterium]|nr:hypothetical protein [Alphaproteobacteria bacterium]
MSLRTLLPVALLPLAACTAAPGPAGLWFFQYGPLAYGPTTNTCEENFVDASCPTDDGEVETPDFTVDIQSTESNGAVFFELLAARNGDWLMIVNDGLVLVGTEQDDVYSFAWTGTSDYKETRSHVDGYDASEMQILNSHLTLDLTYDKEAMSFSGSLSQAFQATREWTEDDTGAEELAGYFGYINKASYSYLTSDDEQGKGADPRSNQWDTAECSEGTCRVKLVSNGSTSRDMVGVPIDGDNVNAGEYFGFGNDEGGDLFVGLLGD